MLAQPDCGQTALFRPPSWRANPTLRLSKVLFTGERKRHRRSESLSFLHNLGGPVRP